jgi:hypothetical protein
VSNLLVSAVHTRDVGSSKSRGRKRSRHLPKVREEAQGDVPPVMWPARGSGLEASPYSPAGVAQAYWRLVRAKRPRTHRERNQATIAGAVLVGLILLGATVGLIIHLVG